MSLGTALVLTTLCVWLFAHVEGGTSDADANTVRVQVNLDDVVGKNDDWFLSTTIDIATLVNFDHCNFSSPRLENLAKPLDFRYMRVGGTQGDFTFYNLTHDAPSPRPPPPPPFQKVLYKDVWDGINDFALRSDLHVFFGINAGEGARDPVSGDWTADLALTMLDYNVQQGFNIAGYEFSNEPNLLRFYVKNKAMHIDGAQWAKDMPLFTETLRSVNASLRSVCCDVAYVPLLGEIADPFMADFVAAGGLKYVDAVTWHFYPLIGADARVAKILPPSIDPFNATAIKLTYPIILDQVSYWAERLEATLATGNDTNMHGVRPDVWLGETGSAVGGGQNGVSNVFADTLEYVDKMGQMTARNVSRMFRQTLCGSRDQYYALISHALEPHPTYFTTLLINNLFGTSAYRVQSDNPAVRAYSFSARAEAGSIVTGYPGNATALVVLINLRDGPTTVADLCVSSSLSSLEPGTNFTLWALTPSTPGDLTASQPSLNGVPLAVDASGQPPALPGVQRTWLPGASASSSPSSNGCVAAPDAMEAYAVWIVALF